MDSIFNTLRPGQNGRNLWSTFSNLKFFIIHFDLNSIHILVNHHWFRSPKIKTNHNKPCIKPISRTGTSNYIPQILWDVITSPCPWYLRLAQHSSYDGVYWTRLWRQGIPDSKVHGPTWGPSGADRTQVDPMLAPWTLLSGLVRWIHRYSQWHRYIEHLANHVSVWQYTIMMTSSNGNIIRVTSILCG